MGVIYTAIFSRYDDLKEPRIITPGWRYVVFTDQPLKSKVWEVRHANILYEGPQRTARQFKISGFDTLKEERTIWIDATFIINCNLDQWWARCREPFTVIRHPERVCAYEEGLECIRQNRGNPREIRNQLTAYEQAGLPRRNGLVSTGILMRKVTPEVKAFCDEWQQQVDQFSVRDQLSFAFTAWKFPGAFHTMQWDYRKGSEFFHVPHIGNPKRIHRLMQFEG